MAGIGETLNKIFRKRTITSDLMGVGYSTIITVAPMVLVIGCILAMQRVLGFSRVGYAERNLFAITILYVFIFALLTASPFNAVLSRYMSDVIYEDRYDDILPCFYVGLLVNIVFSSLFGIPFCLWEWLVGKVDPVYVFTGYCGFVALVMVFYSMLYLSIAKDYQKISSFFAIGMIFAFCLSWVLVNIFHVDICYAMLLSLSLGFLLTACLEIAIIIEYFQENSGRYKRVFTYFKLFWKLVCINFLYTLGLYVHNFIFWTVPSMNMHVVNTFVCAPNYDMASCLAMFTNITMTIIFISQVEMHFRDRYKVYSEAVIGGRGVDIENAKKRMFGQLAWEVMSLVRIQFIVSVVIFIFCIILLPLFGFSGMIMQIYPCLATGYFILFTMYSNMIFQYYFNDLTGALMTTASFCAGTIAGTIFSTHLPVIWYGLGLVIGTMIGWTVAYYRLRWTEKNMDTHIFCVGDLFKRQKGIKPSGKVYDRYTGKFPGAKEAEV